MQLRLPAIVVLLLASCATDAPRRVDAGDRVADGAARREDAGRDARGSEDAGGALSLRGCGETPLGADLRDDGSLGLRVFSASATRVEAWLYDAPTAPAPRLRRELRAAAGGEPCWSVSLPRADLEDAGLGGTIYYGYRAW